MVRGQADEVGVAHLVPSKRIFVASRYAGKVAPSPVPAQVSIVLYVLGCQARLAMEKCTTARYRQAYTRRQW
jgi:hypothetical protein